MLEAANSQKAAMIYELKEEMDGLKSRLGYLESERKQLENSNLNQYEVAMQQMKTLQKVKFCLNEILPKIAYYFQVQKYSYLVLWTFFLFEHKIKYFN